MGICSLVTARGGETAFSTPQNALSYHRRGQEQELTVTGEDVGTALIERAELDYRPGTGRDRSGVARRNVICSAATDFRRILSRSAPKMRPINSTDAPKQSSMPISCPLGILAQIYRTLSNRGN